VRWGLGGGGLWGWVCAMWLLDKSLLEDFVVDG